MWLGLLKDFNLREREDDFLFMNKKETINMPNDRITLL